MNEVSKRLLAAIEAAGLSYRELSEITGIPKSAIQRYAAGTTENFPSPRLKAIAEAVGVTAEYILGWEKEEKPIPEDELDNELINLLSDLTPQETAQVIGFVAGLKAAREVPSSPRK